jgi:hypothetical protein
MVRFVFNLNTYYSKFKGQATDYHVDADVISFNVYAQQTFKLSKTTTAELSGFYTAPSIWQELSKQRLLAALMPVFNKLYSKAR